jgi:hypothetical protein
MKLFLVFTFLISLFACDQNTKPKQNETINVYIAGCDSIFYCADRKFNYNNLKGNKKDDSAFIQRIIEAASNSQKTIFLKPFGGYCGGTAATTTNLMELFTRKKIKAIIAMPDSTEEKLFNDVSLEKAVQMILNKTGGFKLNIPKDDDSFNNLEVKAEASITFVPFNNNRLLYYKGEFKDTMAEINYTSAKQLITQFRKQVKSKDLMFIIKSDKNATLKNIIDLFDLFANCHIPPGHFAETDLNDKEQEYLNNLILKDN